MDHPLLRLGLNISHFYCTFLPYLLDLTILNFLEKYHDFGQNFRFHVLHQTTSTTPDNYSTSYKIPHFTSDNIENT